MRHGTTHLTDTEQRLVRDLVRRHTLPSAATLLGVDDHTVLRAGGGLAVQRGSRVILRIALARLAAEAHAREPQP